MSNYPYEHYVDIVTKRYFQGVDNFDLDMVMDCFHKDAVLGEMTSNTVHDGYDAIKEMFVDCSNFTHGFGMEILYIRSMWTSRRSVLSFLWKSQPRRPGKNCGTKTATASIWMTVGLSEYSSI